MSTRDPVPYDHDPLTFFKEFLESMSEFEEKSYGNAVDSDLLRRFVLYLRDTDSLTMLKDPMHLHLCHLDHAHTPVVLAISMFSHWTYNNRDESIWRAVLKISLDISNIMFRSPKYKRHYVYSEEDNEMLNTLRDDILDMQPIHYAFSRQHVTFIFELLNPVDYMVFKEDDDDFEVETRYYRWIMDEMMGEIDY